MINKKTLLEPWFILLTGGCTIMFASMSVIFILLVFKVEIDGLAIRIFMESIFLGTGVSLMFWGCLWYQYRSK